MAETVSLGFDNRGCGLLILKCYAMEVFGNPEIQKWAEAVFSFVYQWRIAESGFETQMF